MGAFGRPLADGGCSLKPVAGAAIVVIFDRPEMADCRPTAALAERQQGVPLLPLAENGTHRRPTRLNATWRSLDDHQGIRAALCLPLNLHL
jgi:hypothetical protein